MKLDPDKCIVRFCRECSKPMVLESYEWDSDYRWYNFHCNNCDYDVKLSENITQDVRNWNLEEGDFLEPLTKEELGWQNSPESEKADEKMFDKIKKDRDGKSKKQKRIEGHMLTDKELEDLK